MLTLHHLIDSRSQRILWLLEELGVEYKLKIYQRNSNTQLAPDTLRAPHPLGKSPVLTDGEKNIAESAVIIEYLLSQHPGQILRPETATDNSYFDYQYWMHFAEASLMPPLLLNLVFTAVKNSPMPFIVKPVAGAIANRVDKAFIAPNIQRNFEFVDAHLKEHEWFLGEQLSGADFQMSFPLEAALASSQRMRTAYPHVKAYVERVQARPAYQRSIEKSGTYSYLLAN